MRTVAFATCRGRPAVTADDAWVGGELPSDVALAGVPWDEPGTDWGAFDAVVVRSTWDYHLRRDEFEAWLDALDRAAARVRNPTPLLRWNLDKTYLRKLAGRGVEVVPTRWLARHEAVDLGGLLEERGWDRAVIKPTVGASSCGLRIVDRATAREGQTALEATLAEGGAMVQPLLSEVAEGGEWSLVFLRGEPSHAVIKRARPGDVRVQSDFGGSVEPAAPAPELVDWAAGALASAGGEPLYARVDAVETEAGPLLMELELIEPQLFLGSAPGAAARLADAIAALL